MDHIVTRTCLTSLAIACLVSCMPTPAPRPATSSSLAHDARPDEDGSVQTTGLVLVLGSAGLISISIPAAIALNDVSDTQAMGAIIALNAALGTLGIIGLVLATWDDGAKPAPTKTTSAGKRTARAGGAALSPAAETAGGRAAAVLSAAPSTHAEDAVEPECIEHDARLPGDADDLHRATCATNTFAERHHRPDRGRVEHADR